MRLLKIVFVLGVAASIGATYFDTNAQRMARGLPPLPPIRRATPVAVAKRAGPSGSYNDCNTGSLRCCDSVKTFNHRDDTKGLSELFRIALPVNIPVGFGCSPLLAIQTCQQETMCCEDNEDNGNGILIKCSPVNVL